MINELYQEFMLLWENAHVQGTKEDYYLACSLPFFYELRTEAFNKGQSLTVHMNGFAMTLFGVGVEVDASLHEGYEWRVKP